MKNPKRDRRDASDEIQEGIELLFGAETDLNDAELDAELKALGVDSSVLQKKAHEHLRALAQHHFISLDREVPNEMNKAIAQLRPQSDEQQAQGERNAASQCIETILSAAKAAKAGLKSLQSTAMSTTATPQFAFRNQTDLTDADLEILNGAQAELDEAIIKGSGSEGSKDE